MVHRVDGPIGVYRGFDDGTDRRIEAMNAELAHATVLQSQFSLDAHRELGIRLVAPVVITNAPDPAIFHPAGEREPVGGTSAARRRRQLVGQSPQGRRRAPGARRGG